MEWLKGKFNSLRSRSSDNFDDVSRSMALSVDYDNISPEDTNFFTLLFTTEAIGDQLMELAYSFVQVSKKTRATGIQTEPSARSLLHDYLHFFLQRLDAVTGLLERSDKDTNQDTLRIDINELMKEFVFEMTAIFEELKQMMDIPGPSNLSGEMVELTQLLLQHIVFLVKKSGNRRLLAYHDGVWPIFELGAYLATKISQQTQTTDGSDEKARFCDGPMMRFLVDNLSHIVHIAQHLYDPVAAWRKYLISWDTHTTLDIGADNLIWRQRKSLNSVLAFLIESLRGLLNIINNDFLLTPRQYRLRIELLHTIGSTIMFNQVAQNKIGQSGGLALLLDMICCPRFLSSARNKLRYFDDNSIPSDVLQAEFCSQLLAWHVLRAATQINSKNMKKVNEMGGFNKVVDLILWVARLSPSVFSSGPQSYQGLDTFPLCPSLFASNTQEPSIGTVVFPTFDENTFNALATPPVSHDSLPLPSLNLADFRDLRELDILFRMVFSSAVVTTDKAPRQLIRSDSALNATSNADSGTGTGTLGALMFVSPATRLLSLLLAIFDDNQRAHDDNRISRTIAKRHHGAPLQWMLLAVVFRALKQSEDFVNAIARDINFFDVLFSEYFYRVDVFDDHDRNPALCSFVLALMAALSTWPDSVNMCPLEKMTQVLASSSDNLLVVAEICECLSLILHSARQETQQTLMQLSFFSLLVRIVSKHCNLALIADEDTQSTPTVLPALFERARWAALATLKLFLSEHPDVSMYAFTDKTSKEILLDVVTTSNNRTTATFCLNRLGVIFEHVISAKGNDIKIVSSGKLLAFVSHFLEKLPSDFNSHRLFTVLMDMLDFLLMLMHKNTKEMQKILPRGNLVRVLLNLLAQPCVLSDMRKQLAVKVVHVLTVYLSFNAANKSSFAQELGYLPFLCALLPKSSILRALHAFGPKAGDNPVFPKASSLKQILSTHVLSEEAKDFMSMDDPFYAPWPELLLAVQCLLTDTIVDDTNTQQLSIENPAVLQMLFQMYLVMDDGMRRRMLRDLLRMVNDFHINKIHCCERHLILTLLKLIPISISAPHLDLLFAIIEVLASFSIRASELREALNLARPDENGRLPPYLGQFLQTLQLVAGSDVMPCFFQFSGEGSGLKLPALERWPTNGYTIFMWIRVEAFQRQRRPRLYSFQNVEGQIYSCYLFQNSLFLAVDRDGIQIMFEIPGFKIKPQRWYFIGLSHQFGRSKKGTAVQGDLSLTVDGQLQSILAVDYPQFISPPSFCRIACSVATTSNNDVDAAGCVASFSGQIASMTFTSDAIEPAVLQAIYELGPGYSGQFTDEDVSNYHSSRSSTPLLFDVPFRSLLIFSYNAKTSRDNRCPNSALATEEKARKVGGAPSSDAILIDTVRCAPTHFRSVVHGLGGFQIFLPIVPLLDLEDDAASSKIMTTSSDDPATSESSESGSGSLGMTYLLLIRALLHKNQRNQFDALRSRSIPTLSYLLQNVHPRHFPYEAIDLISDIVSEYRLEKSNELADEFMSCFLMEPRLWIYRSCSEQERYLHHLLKLKFNRDDHPVKISFLLAVLETFYWYKPHPHADVCPDQVTLAAKQWRYFSDAGTPSREAITLSRPPLDERRKLRQIILNIALDIIQAHSSVETTRPLLHVLQQDGFDDPLYTIEILELIHRILKTKEDSDIVELIIQQAGVEVIFALLRRDNQRIKLLTLNMILYALISSKMPDKIKKKLRMEGSDFAIYSWLLQGLQMDEVACSALMQLLFEAPFLHPETLEEVLRPSLLPSPLPFRQPSILLVIWSLLPKASLDQAAVVLLDILFHISQSPANATAVAKLDGWQHRLLSIIGAFASQPISTDAKYSTTVLSIVDVVARIFAKVVWTSFLEDKNSWRVMEQSMIRMIAQKLPYAHEFGVALCHRVTRHILDEYDAQDKLAQPFQMNLSHLIMVVEEALFYQRTMAFSSARIRLNYEAHMASNSTSSTLSRPSSPTGVSSSLLAPIDKSKRESSMPESSIPSVTFMTESSSVSSSLQPNKLGLSVVNEERPVAKLLENCVSSQEDQQLAEETLQLIVRFQLLSLSNFTVSIETPGKSHLRQGGVFRVAFRILLHLLPLPSAQLCQFVTFVCNTVIEHHLNPAAGVNALLAMRDTDADVRKRVMALLYQLHQSIALSKQRPNCNNYRLLVPAYRFLLRKWQAALLPSWTNPKNEPMTIPMDVLQNDTPIEPFLSFINTPDWLHLVNSTWLPFRKFFDEDNGMIAGTIQRRDNDVLRTLNDAQRKQEHAEAASVNRFQTVIQQLPERNDSIGVNGTLGEVGLTRFAFEADRRATARAWRNMAESLGGERGVWCPPDFKPENVHWKLDRYETSQRMRRKLTVNYDFDDHKEASARRDKLGPESITAEANRKALKLRAVSPSEQADDDIGDEDDWSNVALATNNNTSGSDFETLMTSNWVKLIFFTAAIKGRLEVSNRNLYFYVDPDQRNGGANDPTKLDVLEESTKDRKWALEEIKRLYLRRHLHRKCAFELFFEDRTNLMFTFSNGNERDKFIRVLLAQRPLKLQYLDARSPKTAFKRQLQTMTAKWQRHEMSNFEYLMYLNTIAGRTFNDLTQYPVFPWIIADYTSKKLDLTQESTFRDLKKPIGALNAKRLQGFLERAAQMEDDEVEGHKFLYGTHYSSSGSVLYFLIRLEPFTTLHIALQSGRFDHADRLFYSIVESWKSCNTSSSDVKELIPEFFFMPEFLENADGFDLGVKQTGLQLNHVELPAWASSPHEFIRLHREALESDYVSQNLHHWIDLIFGFKQTGQAAIDANNVFHHLTYENAINLDDITDPTARIAVEAQISNFGQTPAQLLRKPHPQRFAKPESPPSMLPLRTLRADFVPISVNSAPVCFIGSVEIVNSGMFANSLERLVIVDTSCCLGIQRVQFANAKNTQGQRAKVIDIESITETRKSVQVPLAHDISVRPELFAVTPDGRHMFSCGHWDNSFRVINLDALKITQSIVAHDDVVTCAALTEDGSVLITGSRDTTLMAWEVEYSNGGCAIRTTTRPLQVFYGHDEEVVCVAANSDHDLVVSGSKDGTCILHSLRQGRYIRTLRLFVPVIATMSYAGTRRHLSSGTILPDPQLVNIVDGDAVSALTAADPIPTSELPIPPELDALPSPTMTNEIDQEVEQSQLQQQPTATLKLRSGARTIKPVVTHVMLTPDGNIVLSAIRNAHPKESHELYLFSINGKKLKKVYVSEKINHMIVTRDNRYIFTAGDSGTLGLLTPHSLHYVDSVRLAKARTGAIAIHSLCQLVSDDAILCVGLSNGQLLLLQQPQSTLQT